MRTFGEPPPLVVGAPSTSQAIAVPVKGACCGEVAWACSSGPCVEEDARGCLVRANGCLKVGKPLVAVAWTRHRSSPGSSHGAPPELNLRGNDDPGR